MKVLCGKLASPKPYLWNLTDEFPGLPTRSPIMARPQLHSRLDLPAHTAPGCGIRQPETRSRKPVAFARGRPTLGRRRRRSGPFRKDQRKQRGMPLISSRGNRPGKVCTWPWTPISVGSDAYAPQTGLRKCVLATFRWEMSGKVVIWSRGLTARLGAMCVGRLGLWRAGGLERFGLGMRSSLLKWEQRRLKREGNWQWRSTSES